MKIGNLLVNAAYLGERVLTAIAVGAAKVWEGVSKYIKFKDPVVEQICLKWSSDGIGLTPEDAAKVTDIGATFQGNTEITSFDELEYFTGLRQIYGFSDCSYLANIVIPNAAISLAYGAFARSGLTNIAIPDSVISIGDYCFVSCPLKTIRLGASTTIAQNTFSGVRADNIYVGSIAAWCGYPITSIQSDSAKLFVNDELVTNVVIPAHITQLRASVFKGFIDLQSVSFEGEITSIGGDAFADSGLTGFVCPQGIVSLSGAVFPRCKKLKTLDLYNYHGEVGAYFCINCSSLTIVKLGHITNIGNSAFHQCTALRSVLIAATTPPTLGSSVFGSNTIIYVPYESVEAYKSSTNWSNYADRIKPLSEYKE